MDTSKAEAQRELFGKLFGFKVGDRVKYRVKIFGEDRYYWKYGRIQAIEAPSSVMRIMPYLVIWDNSDLSYHASDELVRVRPYGR